MVVMHTASGGATEAYIPTIVVAAFTSFVALAAVLAQAAPLPPSKISAAELGACPPMEQAAHERGSGSRPVPCSERWGHCHSDRCFPMLGDNLYRPRRERNWLD
jgi:hypothetical protein